MATTTSPNFKNFIGGEWVDAASGETFESTSPANGETIGVFPKSGSDDVDRAVAAAKAAYEEWRLVPAPKRGEILFRFAQLLAEHKDDVTDLMTHEMGKVKAEAALVITDLRITITFDDIRIRRAAQQFTIIKRR
jgi:aldehyde dehydrogenase (NAD+)